MTIRVRSVRVQEIGCSWKPRYSITLKQLRRPQDLFWTRMNTEKHG